KIPEIIDGLPSDAPLVITNAVYFKGTWTKPFDRAQTGPGDFHLLNGKLKKIPMMHQIDNFMYAQLPDLQIISLPYRADVSMYILLPSSSADIYSFVKGMDLTRWRAVLSEVSRPRSLVGVNLVLPRFRIEYAETLNESLTALGMGIAFEL